MYSRSHAYIIRPLANFTEQMKYYDPPPRDSISHRSPAVVVPLVRHGSSVFAISASDLLLSDCLIARVKRLLICVLVGIISSLQMKCVIVLA